MSLCIKGLDITEDSTQQQQQIKEETSYKTQITFRTSYNILPND